MARPMTTRRTGHITTQERKQREAAEKALQSYPPLPVEAPEWLDNTAKKEWNRIVPLLKQSTPVSSLDTSLIATHCALYSTIIKCAKGMDKEGVVVGDKQSPYFMASDKAIKSLKSIDAQIGMTPRSRAALEIHKAVASDTPDDEFEAMLS
ncbi:phage terminase small subunit P27 family [Limosilactobacillus sp.]|uniref:phage terminase small subunit P27 family n=1 Tax=Limosilactobacillus sp. TaxID=2773925 RepID=UPI00345E7912